MIIQWQEFSTRLLVELINVRNLSVGINQVTLIFSHGNSNIDKQCEAKTMRVTVNALKKRSALWVMYESLVRAILVTAAGRLPTQLAVMPVCFVQHDTVR